MARKKYDDGGLVDSANTNNTGPGTPNWSNAKDPNTIAAWNNLKQKYAGNLPKITQNGEQIGALDKRLDWMGWANQNLPTGGTPAQLAKKAAQATGFKNPGLLLSSSMEEGVGMRWKGDDAYSQGYDDAKIDQSKYPVDGFRAYGLDQIGGRADEFIQKGYLPKDFKKNMTPFHAANEQDQKSYYDKVSGILSKNNLIDDSLKTKYTNAKTGVLDKDSYYGALDNAAKNYKGQLPTLQKSAYTAAFKDDQSAYMAKAAFMRAEQDNIQSYAKQKGYNLTPQEQDFFTTASYNGGSGSGKEMLDYYGSRKELGNNGFLKDRMKSKGQIYDNVMPRYAGASLFNSEGYFKKGGRMEYKDGTQDPITGNKPQLAGDADHSVFSLSGEGTPSRDQQEGDFFTQDGDNFFAGKDGPYGGTPNRPDKIIPISQIYGSSKDVFGNNVVQAKERYVTNDGQVNTVQDQQKINDQLSQQNLDNANAWKTSLDNVSKGADLGITAINAYFAKQDQIKNRRMDYRNAILGNMKANGDNNPYLNGTGSQAIMKYGGRLKYDNGGPVIGDPSKSKSQQASADATNWIPIANQINKLNTQYEMAYNSVFNAGKLEGWDDNKLKLELDKATSPIKQQLTTLQSQMPKKFADGGEVNAAGSPLGINILDGGKYQQISTSDHSNPMVEFQGREHKDGGIGLNYGGNVAEVENKEIGWVDSQGGLNIFGKLKVPGTNQTFRKTAKDVAEQESQVDKTKSKYLNILNNAKDNDPYQESALSTAKIMFKSLDNQSKEIAQKKEALASYQNLILSMTQDQTQKKANGGVIPKFAQGGVMKYRDGGDIEKLQQALGKYESGNGYDARGPIIKSGMYKGQRALGKYQVMPGNLAAWSKEALGKEVSEEDFLKNPDIQDQIVKHRLSEISKQYPDPKDIASVWFSGRPLKGNSSSDGNNTVPQYVNNVMKIYNGDDNSGSSSTGYPTNFKNFKGNSAPNGISPAAFYKDPDVVKALRDDKTYSSVDDAVWGPEHQKVWDNLPQAKKDVLLKQSQTIQVDPTSTEGTTTAGVSTSTQDKTSQVNITPMTPQEKAVANGYDTPYGKATHPATGLKDAVNISNGQKIRGNLSPLAMEQIAPELMAIATNKRDAVPALSYDPQLKQTFDMSFQLGRNENESTFNSASKIAEVTGNVDALSQMAAQKYRADESYNNQEVQGNAQQKLQTYNSNTDILNDARMRNLQGLDNQMTRQAQADFNTKAQDQSAFNSISAKVLQNGLENKTYNAYANLFQHYGFDEKGNVTFNPDKVVTKFNAGQAQQFGLLAAQRGVADVMNQGDKTTTKYDKDGNVKQTTVTDDDLKEFNDVMKMDIPDSKRQQMLGDNYYAKRYYRQ